MLSEVIRRVTGMSLKQFITEKITTPLGADFPLGFLDKDADRISHLITPPPTGSPPAFTPGPLFVKAIANPMMPPDVGNRPAWRQSEIGASNGYTNAHALNKILSNVTLAGSPEHKTLLSKSTVDKIFEEQSYGPDLAIGQPIRFGIGYAIKSKGEKFDDWLPDGDIAFWGGSGGSLGIMDVGRKVTITYAMNKRSPTLIGNTASRAYISEIYEALGVKV